MLGLLIVKVLSLVFRAIDYHFISVCLMPCVHRGGDIIAARGVAGGGLGHHILCAAVVRCVRAFVLLFCVCLSGSIRVCGGVTLRSSRAMLLFGTIVLIGAGFGFVKHVLSPKEKQLIAVVLALQVSYLCVCVFVWVSVE
jgi:hypothetical protein